MLDKSNNIKHLDKEYSVSELYFALKKHAKIIFIVFSLVLFSSIYFTLITKPVYESTGLIMVSGDQKSMSMLDFNLGANRNYIENEIQILKSKTTAELTVDELLSNDFKNDLYLFGTKKYEPTYYRKYLTLGLLDK